jgi:transcriptional regulator with XRE-family HTH domain
MDEAKRKRLEAAGYVLRDFDQFAIEILGMTPEEAKETRFRADLGSAIRRLRRGLKLSQAAFGKVVGLTQPKVARVEIAAPEVSLDLMLKAFLAAGGEIRYDFELPLVADQARSKAKRPDQPSDRPIAEAQSNGAVRATPRVETPRRRKATKVV